MVGLLQATTSAAAGHPQTSAPSNPEDRAQRSLSLRQRQEVQALLR